LVIGAQKAGTTWLSRVLDYHPEVWLPPIKELNYFNQIYMPSASQWEPQARIEQADAATHYYETHRPLEPKQQSRFDTLPLCRAEHLDDSDYKAIFSHAPIESVCGEICPDYALLPRGCIASIVANQPGIRVVFIIRDPIDRAWSHMRMLAEGRFHVGWWRGFLEPDVWPVVRVRTHYPAIIRKWQACLPSGSFLVLSYDRITQQPEDVIADVCNFLGVRFDRRFFPTMRDRVAESPPVDFEDDAVAALRERLRDTYDEMATIYPNICGSWLRRRYPDG
jgi:hypothetical protein